MEKKSIHLKQLILQCTEQQPHAKNHPSQNVHSAKIEKPCSTIRINAEYYIGTFLKYLQGLSKWLVENWVYTIVVITLCVVVMNTNTYTFLASSALMQLTMGGVRASLSCFSLPHGHLLVQPSCPLCSVLFPVHLRLVYTCININIKLQGSCSPIYTY